MKEGGDERRSALAAALNLGPERIEIQHQTLKNGRTYSHYYETRIQSPHCALRLALTPDFLRVYLIRATTRPGCTTALVAKLLREHHLVPVDPPLLRAALKPSEPGWKKIAQGRPPRSGRDEELEYTFPSEPLQPFFSWLAEGTPPEFPAQMRALWVEPGQRLAERRPAGEGREGLDVFGRRIPAPSGRELSLAGGVSLSEDGSAYQAEDYGYFFVHQGRIGLRAALEVEAEGFAAHFLFVPSSSPHPPTPELLQDLLAARGICCGILAQACHQIARAFEENRAAPARFCIARGRPPEDGRDARVEGLIDGRPRPGKLTPDGRIDFRETCSGLEVGRGAELARFLPATRGEAGFSVLGDQLAPTPGREQRLKAGPHVEVETHEGWQIFRAAIDGRVRLENEILAVYEVLNVDTDVDYGCGNIDFKGDVHIAGSVRAGFVVKAGGRLVVRGQVEAGALLQARGDIAVGGGIVGERTQVRAGGALTTWFIQDARVRTGGDLMVGSYIFGASVRAGGRVLVRSAGGRRSGAIAGGRVLAAGGIEARFAGSPSSTRTELVLGIDPDLEDELSQRQHQLHHCQQAVERLQHFFGLEEVTIFYLKRLLKRTPPGKRNQLAASIQRWHKLSQAVQALGEHCEQLKKDLLQPALQARLEIAGIIYPGVEVRLGEHRVRFGEEVRHTCLSHQSWREKFSRQQRA